MEGGVNDWHYPESDFEGLSTADRLGEDFYRWYIEGIRLASQDEAELKIVLKELITDCKLEI